MSKHLTPLAVCERLIGPIEDIAMISGRHRKSAYKWRHPSSGRDAGDIPSARDMRRLLDHSEQHGLGVTADHLVRGAPLEDIEAIELARARATAGAVAAE